MTYYDFYLHFMLDYMVLGAISQRDLNPDLDLNLRCGCGTVKPFCRTYATVGIAVLQNFVSSVVSVTNDNMARNP